MITDNPSARAAVDAILEDFFEDRLARARRLGLGYESLWQAMRHAAHGGKRLRPRMVLLAHQSLNGSATQDALLAAAAVELLHTALLFHDDVLDGDLVRRGEPNLPGQFVSDALERGSTPDQARSWGQTAGLLGGDLLISDVHTLISRIQSPARSQIHEILNDSLFVTAAGELADVGFALGTVESEREAITQMMAEKTASYSFAAPLRIGAALAGASPSASEELERLGTSLGFIYQLRDDVLGVFGQPETLGKSTDGDLREGKRTLMIAYAERSEQWMKVRHLFGRRNIDAEQVEQLRSALIACGAAAAVSRLMSEHIDRLCEHLELASLPVALRTELSRVARLCGEREV